MFRKFIEFLLHGFGFDVVRYQHTLEWPVLPCIWSFKKIGTQGYPIENKMSATFAKKGLTTTLLRVGGQNTIV